MAKKISRTNAATLLMEHNHNLQHDKAIAMVKKFQKSRLGLNRAKKLNAPVPPDFPELCLSYSFNASVFTAILKKPGVAGIRMYPAVNDKNIITLVLVGFDSEGNNITSTSAALKSGSALNKGEDGEDECSTYDDAQFNPPYDAPALP